MTGAAAARRWQLASPATANAVGTLGAVLAAAGIALSVPTHQITLGNLVTLFALYGSFTAVGVVVARHQPANPLGWLLAAVGLFTVAGGAAGGYEILVYRMGHHTWPFGPVAAGLEVSWAPLIILLPLAILLFPDGRLPSRGWRVLLLVYAAMGTGWLAAIGVTVANAVSQPRVGVLPGGGLAAVNNPTGWFAAVTDGVTAAYVVFWLAFVARQVMSWRRAGGERRQQLKWLLSGAVVCLLGGVAIVVGSVLDPTANSPQAQATVTAATVALAALPVGIGIGILKYRLYEIDRIISRTLGYAIVTGLLVGVYAGLVLLATRVLGLNSPAVVAAATLAAAALFAPLRRRVQKVVDRRFNRARYDADRTIAAFAARLQDAADPDGTRADLLGTVHRALEPAHASLWLASDTPGAAPWAPGGAG